MNILENIQFPCQLWNRNGIPHANALGGWIAVGGQGLLSPNLTGLPQVNPTALLEISGGPFQQEQAFSLASANRTEEVLEDDVYVDLNDFHALASQPLQNRNCFIQDVMVRPPGWNDNLHGPFVPHRILKITKVHSSYTSNNYDVIIAFVPVNDARFQNPAPNRYNFVDPALAGSIMGWCCGPPTGHKCRIGARMAGRELQIFDSCKIFYLSLQAAALMLSMECI